MPDLSVPQLLGVRRLWQRIQPLPDLRQDGTARLLPAHPVHSVDELVKLRQKLPGDQLDLSLLGLAELRLRGGEEVKDRQLLLVQALTGGSLLFLVQALDEVLELLEEPFGIDRPGVVFGDQLFQPLDQLHAGRVLGCHLFDLLFRLLP